jgi:hypothetical protein
MDFKDTLEKRIVDIMTNGIDAVEKAGRKISWMLDDMATVVKSNARSVKYLVKATRDDAFKTLNDFSETGYLARNYKQIGGFVDAAKNTGSFCFTNKHPTANVNYQWLNYTFQESMRQMRREGYDEIPKPPTHGQDPSDFYFGTDKITRNDYIRRWYGILTEAINKEMEASAPKAGFKFNRSNGCLIQSLAGGIEKTVAEIKFSQKTNLCSITCIDPSAGPMLAYALGNLKDTQNRNRYKNELKQTK